MNRQPFYDHVRTALYKGTLPAWQQEPLDRIIDGGASRGRRLEDTAYVLATAHHETGRFRFMEEIGKGEGHPYGVPVEIYKEVSVAYYGRGFVQLTWLTNYGKFAALTGHDLVNSPHLATRPDIASDILWEGMIRGAFRSASLADFITDESVDYVGARDIVNGGSDKAELIAEYAREFEMALRLIDSDFPVCPHASRAGCLWAAAS